MGCVSLIINQHLSVSLKDPSRNHRAYRLTVAKLEPPLIPFMPLLIKGNSKETHRSSQEGVCGEENEQEPNQAELFGKNGPLLPPSSSPPLPLDFLERVGKIYQRSKDL